MITKETTAQALATIEFLPDGTATDDIQLFFKSWAAFAQKQVAMGKIRLHEVPEYDAETGQVPNSFIKKVYEANRKVH